MLKKVTDHEIGAQRVAHAVVRVGDAAFLFADIVGFTAFTEAHGDARAAELAWRLRLGVERQLGAEAHVVKTLGDAVMVRVADPAEAAAAGLRIVQQALSAPLDPAVRVGIACGTAVECDGDFFGAAVNLAARLAAIAGAGEVLVTDQVAHAARTRSIELELERRGTKRLHNVTRAVSVHAVRERERASARVRPVRAQRAAGWALRPNIAGGHVHA
jgi:class 3 adenylate cyclase